MATTINPAAVITEYGSYYHENGQNLASLLMRPFNAFGTREAFTNVPTDGTRLEFSDVTVGEILQGYQDAFTAKGSVVFAPVTIDLHPVKVDVQFNPQNLVYSWLGFLTSNDTDRKTWPFTRWIIEVYILNQIFADLEEKAIFNGVYAAPTAGTASAANTVLNGLKKLINAGITAGKITPLTTGALETDEVLFCTQIEAFVKQIPKKFWKKQMVLNMGQEEALRFAEGKDKKYNSNYAKEGSLVTVKGFPNISVAGRASHDGSEKIWVTPKENVVFATKGFANASGFQLESVDRNVKIFTDFHIGLGFLLGDLVFTNDVELV